MQVEGRRKVREGEEKREGEKGQNRNLPASSAGETRVTLPHAQPVGLQIGTVPLEKSHLYVPKI